MTRQLSDEKDLCRHKIRSCHRPPEGPQWTIQASREGTHVLEAVWEADLAVDELITAEFRASEVAQLPLLDYHGALLPKAGPTPAGNA